MTPIDYKKIADSIKKYKILGYEYIEVPWIVKKENIVATLPKTSKAHEVLMSNIQDKSQTELGFLVGSGEQSFIEIKYQLKPSHKYQTATPCFRDENPDELHLNQFFKLELIYVLNKTEDAEEQLHCMIYDAVRIMNAYSITKILKTKDGFDIMINDIEVGSYGIREYKDFRWVYGTGLAEPRISQAISKSNISKTE